LAQGPDAAGGAQDYLVNGRLVGGFGLIAWPVEYGTSGVMTFIVNQDGVVWQRDLGDDTARVAKVMRDVNPDAMWVPLAPEQGVSEQREPRPPVFARALRAPRDIRNRPFVHLHPRRAKVVGP